MQEALHRTELDNERREHAATKEDCAKKKLALTALKDQLILKEREVKEARKRTENKDELLKKTMQVLRQEQDAVREKVGAPQVPQVPQVAAVAFRWDADTDTNGTPAALQLREVSRERDSLAAQVKAKEERIQGMENTISIAQEEVGDVKQVRPALGRCCPRRGRAGACAHMLAGALRCLPVCRPRRCNWSDCRSVTSCCNNSWRRRCRAAPRPRWRCAKAWPRHRRRPPRATARPGRWCRTCRQSWGARGSNWPRRRRPLRTCVGG